MISNQYFFAESISIPRSTVYQSKYDIRGSHRYFSCYMPLIPIRLLVHVDLTLLTQEEREFIAVSSNIQTDFDTEATFLRARWNEVEHEFIRLFHHSILVRFSTDMIDYLIGL